MGNLFAILIFAALNFTAGFILLAFIDRERVLKRGEIAGLSYLIGSSALSVECMALWFMGQPFDKAITLAPWLILLFLSIGLLKGYLSHCLRPRPENQEGKSGFIGRIFVVCVIFMAGYILFDGFTRPVSDYDGVSIWALKAKIIYLSHPSPGEFFSVLKASFEGAHADYPLYFPFSFVWFYIFLGSFNDYLVKIVPILNLLSFALVLYSCVIRMASRRDLALMSVFVLISVKQMYDYAALATADQALGIFIFMAFAYLFIWRDSRSPVFLYISAFSTAAAYLTKNEGGVVLILYLIMLLPALLADRKKKYVEIVCLSLLALFLAWVGLKNKYKLENDVFNSRTVKNITAGNIMKRALPIAYEYQRQIFGTKKWNVVWILFFYFLITEAARRRLGAYKYVILPIFLIMAVYAAVFIMTPHDLKWHLYTAGSRLFLHVYPLAVFFIALAAREKRIV